MRRLILAGALVAGLGIPSTVSGQDVEVTLSGFSFSPAEVTIQPGQTVRWRNLSGIHNVVADDGSFHSGSPTPAPWTFDYTFTTEGTYTYHCEPHVDFGMRGTVRVAATSDPDPDPDPEPDPGPEPCVEDEHTLCLNEDRFQVRVTWRDSEGATGLGQALPFTADTGFFWFFNEENLEMMVKVLNACALPEFNTYWVFFAAATNVEYTLTVTDTLADETREYSNPLGVFPQAVGDTGAFDTCP